VIVPGCAADGVATLLLAMTLQTQAGEISLLRLIAGRALMGLGNTLILAALIGTTLFGVRDEQPGIASGALNASGGARGQLPGPALGDCRLSTVGTGSRQPVHRNVDLAIATRRSGMVWGQPWVSRKGRTWTIGRVSTPRRTRVPKARWFWLSPSSIGTTSITMDGKGNL
jgi:hypothetical protein